MDCSLEREQLPAWFDGELDPDEAAAFEQHLSGCACCQQSHRVLRDIRDRLRAGLPDHRAPDSLRRRLGIGRPGHWNALAASCALAFVTGAVAWSLWNGSHVDPGAQLRRDLFASHWRALSAASPIDVASSDRHTVKPWFEGKVAAAPEVRDFADQGFSLAGGRIDYVGEERVPVIVYRRGGHVVDVFVLPADTRMNGSPAVVAGNRADVVRTGGFTDVIVSDLDAASSATLAGLLKLGD